MSCVPFHIQSDGTLVEYVPVGATLNTVEVTSTDGVPMTLNVTVPPLITMDAAVRYEFVGVAALTPNVNTAAELLYAVPVDINADPEVQKNRLP